MIAIVISSGTLDLTKNATESDPVSNKNYVKPSLIF